MTDGPCQLPVKKSLRYFAGFSCQLVRTAPGGSLAKTGSAASAWSSRLPGSGFPGRGSPIALSTYATAFVQDATSLPTATARRDRSWIIGSSLVSGHGQSGTIEHLTRTAARGVPMSARSEGGARPAW
ncbi:MAG TPA: hypothetical protein VH307_22350, partial [Streptosporangiaceae bacterium]|nr:hypothetical protein [Streptosporangiaceae bacterium]